MFSQDNALLTHDLEITCYNSIPLSQENSGCFLVIMSSLSCRTENKYQQTRLLSYSKQVMTKTTNKFLLQCGFETSTRVDGTDGVIVIKMLLTSRLQTEKGVFFVQRFFFVLFQLRLQQLIFEGQLHRFSIINIMHIKIRNLFTHKLHRRKNVKLNSLLLTLIIFYLPCRLNAKNTNIQVKKYIPEFSR